MPLLRRVMVPEVMDQPDLSPERHHHALSGLSRINLLSRAAQTLFRPLAEFQDERKLPQLRVLDVATGAGDVPVRLSKLAARAGRDWRLAGCDRSPLAVEHARRLAEKESPPVEFFVCDALAGPLPDGYDAVLCSLFLHHLDEQQALSLLSTIA